MHPDPRTTRRDFLSHGLVGLATAPSLAHWLRDALEQDPARPWLAAARKVDAWLRTSATNVGGGTAWPVDPTRPGTIQSDLYSGMAGIVLFYLELHHATGDARALGMAREGAAYLGTQREADTPAGLYTGVAGTMVVLEHMFRATGEAQYRDGVNECLRQLARAAKDAPGGIAWNDSTDIVSGSAGIGLALHGLPRGLRAGADVNDLIEKTAGALVQRAQPAGDGLTWLVSPAMTRNYPNFSHGTAGVATFLARAWQSSRRREYLDAALAGERWLRSLMKTTVSGGHMIHHSSPGNEAIFYLSWCHGPPGTARLYRVLAEVTADPRYDAEVLALAKAVPDMKVPERSPGFWNNVSYCCGNAGVAGFFTSLHRRTRDERHLVFAETVMHDALRRGTTDGDGLKWVQAEHRVRPDDVVAQTGLMQGAAGIGLSLLHLDGARAGRAPFVRLPDDPF